VLRFEGERVVVCCRKKMHKKELEIGEMERRVEHQIIN
jgi:hypothetical protein